MWSSAVDVVGRTASLEPARRERKRATGWAGDGPRALLAQPGSALRALVLPLAGLCARPLRRRSIRPIDGLSPTRTDGSPLRYEPLDEHASAWERQRRRHFVGL